MGDLGREISEDAHFARKKGNCCRSCQSTTCGAVNNLWIQHEQIHLVEIEENSLSSPSVRPEALELKKTK